MTSPHHVSRAIWRSSGTPLGERAGHRAQRSNQQWIGGKERQVLLRVEAVLPLVAVGGNARVPLRVPARRERSHRIAQ